MNIKQDHQRIAAAHLLNMMDYATIRGVYEKQLLETIPYSFKHIRGERATVTPDVFYTVLATISEQLADDLWGIRAGHYLNMKVLGLIYRISLKATTIEEAFFYLKDYLNATFPIISVETQSSDRLVKLHLHIDNNRDALNRIILENLLTVMRREIQIMTGKSTNIELFSTFHTSAYPDFWSPADSFYLQFRSTVLRASLKDKGRLHLDILIPEYLKLIETLSADDSFASMVKIALLNLAKPELPDLKTVAQSFNLTPRTLQRRLRAEETTFREIIDNLKRTISEMLLRHKQFTVGDVSLALGYSEPAAFIHSFKKWHGFSPQEARKSYEV
ncbi:MAG: helix-turn-helix domain-containing protein [Balneolales bacterium]